jgi:hypothetical protein
MTAPQLRTLIGLLLLRKLRCSTPEVICRNATRRLQRNEAARFSYYKKRETLAPKRVVKRE